MAGKGVTSVTSFFFFNLVKDFIKTTQPATPPAPLKGSPRSFIDTYELCLYSSKSWRAMPTSHQKSLMKSLSAQKSILPPIQGGGFDGLRRSRRGLFKFQQTLYKTLQSHTNRDTVSRLDHAPVLNDYLTFIHYPKGVTTLKDNFFTK